MASPHSLFIETIVKFPDKTFKNVLIAMFPVHSPRHLLQQPEHMFLCGSRELVQAVWCEQKGEQGGDVVKATNIANG